MPAGVFLREVICRVPKGGKKFAPFIGLSVAAPNSCRHHERGRTIFALKFTTSKDSETPLSRAQVSINPSIGARDNTGDSWAVDVLGTQLRKAA
jgi:hypothetical protein